MADGYIRTVEEVGWDDLFLICKTKNEKYYIQDLKQLVKKSSDNYKTYLFGPFTKQMFEKQRDSLSVDQDLDFDVHY